MFRITDPTLRGQRRDCHDRATVMFDPTPPFSSGRVNSSNLPVDIVLVSYEWIGCKDSYILTDNSRRTSVGRITWF